MEKGRPHVRTAPTAAGTPGRASSPSASVGEHDGRVAGGVDLAVDVLEHVQGKLGRLGRPLGRGARALPDQLCADRAEAAGGHDIPLREVEAVARAGEVRELEAAADVGQAAKELLR